MVSFTAASNEDSSSNSHSAWAGVLARDPGEFLIAALTTRATNSESPSITDGQDEWVFDLSTFIGSFVSPYRYMFGYYRQGASDNSEDSLAWEWLLAGVEATSMVVVAEQDGLIQYAADFNDVADPALDVSIGNAGTEATVLFLLSDAGTTCNGDLILRSDGAGMPAGHGYLEAWAFDGPGPHTVAADAVSGDIIFYYWVELGAPAARKWWVGVVGWGPPPPEVL